MAAFSHPFLLDSVFFPDITIKIPGFSEEPNTTPTTMITPCFSQFYQNDPLPLDASVVSLSNKQSAGSSVSAVVDKVECGDQVTQMVITAMDKKRKNIDGSSSHSAQSKDPNEEQGMKKQKKCNKSESKQLKKPKADKKVAADLENAPTGYIHVRARRGQATDSHSLAERVRREKISERMKLLQALVPGCDKVTGKALMLDEIINYVQSLQNQVEFLSMKLASTNPMFYDFGVDLDSFMVRSEDNVQLLWAEDDQRQKLINQTCLSNNLCAFH